MNGIRGNVIVGQSGGPTAVTIQVLQVYLKQQKTEGQIRCTVCSTVSRDFYRRDMWI